MKKPKKIKAVFKIVTEELKIVSKKQKCALTEELKLLEEWKKKIPIKKLKVAKKVKKEG